MHIKRGIITFFIITVFILNLLVVSSFIKYSDGNNPDKINITSITSLRAIQIAIKAFPMASKVESFNIERDVKYEIKDFWGKNGGKVWSITLNPMDVKQNINVDASSGIIRSYTVIKDYTKLSQTFSSNFTLEEMKKIVNAKISEMQPELSKEVEFTGTDYDNKNNLRGTNETSFVTFNYARKINNLLYDWDGFKVMINSNDGEISYYEFTWSNENLPNEYTILSMDNAKKQFLKYGSPKLMYVRPWTNSNSNEGRKLKLLYSIVNGSYYYLDFNAINAKTGNPVNSVGASANFDIKVIGERNNQNINRSDEKLLKSIDEYDARVLAMKEALKYDIAIDSNDKYKTSLNNNLMGLNQRVFTISWSKDSEKEKFSFVISVNLDTGKVLGFNYFKNKSLNSNNANNPKLTWQEGKNRAIAVVKNKFPQFLGNICLIENEPGKSGKLSENSYYYSFWRTVNGVLFPENSVNIVVDNNGEVVGYGYRWEYIDFPDTTGIIDSKTASDIFINQIGLRLNSRANESNTKSKNNPNTMNSDILVYEANSTSAAYIDAYTGKLKDINGNDVIIQTTK